METDCIPLQLFQPLLDWDVPSTELERREGTWGGLDLTRLTHLPVSGGPWGGEAVSGVGDVDGGSRHGSPTDVERRP